MTVSPTATLGKRRPRAGSELQCRSVVVLCGAVCVLTARAPSSATLNESTDERLIIRPPSPDPLGTVNARPGPLST